MNMNNLTKTCLAAWSVLNQGKGYTKGSTTFPSNSNPSAMGRKICCTTSELIVEKYQQRSRRRTEPSASAYQPLVRDLLISISCFATTNMSSESLDADLYGGMIRSVLSVVPSANLRLLDLYETDFADQAADEKPTETIKQHAKTQVPVASEPAESPQLKPLTSIDISSHSTHSPTNAQTSFPAAQQIPTFEDPATANYRTSAPLGQVYQNMTTSEQRPVRPSEMKDDG